jgi:hypothetical protein
MHSTRDPREKQADDVQHLTVKRCRRRQDRNNNDNVDDRDDDNDNDDDEDDDDEDNERRGLGNRSVEIDSHDDDMLIGDECGTVTDSVC